MSSVSRTSRAGPKKLSGLAQSHSSVQPTPEHPQFLQGHGPAGWHSPSGPARAEHPQSHLAQVSCLDPHSLSPRSLAVPDTSLGTAGQKSLKGPRHLLRLLCQAIHLFR